MAKLKNCVNCGAILHGSRCEYCGTEYDEDTGATLELDEEILRDIIGRMYKKPQSKSAHLS